MKILAFDLDGTCLSGHSQLSPRNRAAIKAAAEKGIIILPATGRNFMGAPNCIKELPEVRYIMTSNGASIYDKAEKKIIYQDLIPNEKAKEAQKILDGYDIHTEYYVDGYACTIKEQFEERIAKFDIPKEALKEFYDRTTFVEGFDQLLADGTVCPEKVNMVPVPPEKYDELKGKLEALGGLEVTSSFPQNMEYNSKTATKGHTLEAFAKSFGINADEVMSLGDSGNDIAMLKYAGYSFAMGNGTDEAKAAAKYITDHCEEDGFAKAVEKYILNA